jgi:DNA repair exonuclease SbcCD ATPase subunit
MIQKVLIKNFQSHRSTQLTFHKGVNVIVGKSDSGKTAIIRALHWLINNRPLGDAVRSNWGGETKVCLTLEDDLKVIKLKSNAENSYTIGDMKLKAFGSEVPDIISNTLQFDEINLQKQLDSPFLLSQSPGEIAFHFNKVAHLDKIHTTTKNIQSFIRNIGQNITSLEHQKTTFEEDITKYEYLEKAEIDIGALETLEKEISVLNNQIWKLNDIIVSLTNIEQEIEKLFPLLSLSAVVIHWIEQYESLDVLETKIKTINILIESYKLNQIQIDTLSKRVKLETPVKTLLEQYQEVDKLNEEYDKIKNHIQAIHFNQIALDKGLITITVLIQQFEKEMPNICPLCDRPIKK